MMSNLGMIINNYLNLKSILKKKLIFLKNMENIWKRIKGKMNPNLHFYLRKHKQCQNFAPFSWYSHLWYQIIKKKKTEKKRRKKK
jgi:hypothetical protein